MLYLVDTAQIEIEKQKGSRFIGFAVPLQEASQVLSHIKRIQNIHPKAKHFCYAWRMRDGKQGYSDDGEPHSSAGLPILKPIVGKDIVDILVVVVRYFGGVKLGVGGLVRAYGLACQAVLEIAQLREYISYSQFSFSYSYDKENAIRRVLSNHTELSLEFEYREQIVVLVKLPSAEMDSLLAALNEALGGQLEWNSSLDM